MSTIDLKLKSYDELIFEITTLNTNNYLLQQKVEQLEKENETLNGVLETLKETNNLLINQKYKLEYELDTLDNKYEQLENIRKEATKLCDEMLSVLYHYDDRKVWEDMKDILNKGSESNE